MKETNVNDYVDLVHEKFPELTRDEVKRIMIYGWKMIVQYVASGNDVNIRDKGFFFFIGRLMKNSLTNFDNYKYKLAKRISFMFKRTKSEWDGHYYFALTENQYIDYLKQNKKKYKIFKNVMLYKLLEECKVYEGSHPYIFRLNEDKTYWMKKFYPEIKTKNAELIIQRDPLNMKELMTSNNKYKYLQ